MSRACIPFTAVVLLGVLFDGAVHGPAIVHPAETLTHLRQPPVPDQDLRWVAFASWLAVLVAAFYLPGAIAPYRYRLGAWLAVWGRAAAALFFLLMYRGEVAALGWINLALFAVQLPLLLLARRNRPRPDPAEAAL